MGPYREAASSTHSGVDSGWVGTEIASRTSRAVLQPPTSFQTEKCGAGERRGRADELNHIYYTSLICHFTHFMTLILSISSHMQVVLTGGMEKAWRCPADRKSLQDNSDSLLCVCYQFSCCRCLQGKETGCHMQSLEKKHQHSLISMNEP